MTGNVTGNVSGDVTGNVVGDLTTSSLTLNGTLLSATGAELNTYTLNLFFDNATAGITNWVPVPKSGTVTAVYAVPNATFGSGANVVFTIYQKVNGQSVADATTIGSLTLTASEERGEVSSVTGLTGAIDQSDAVQIECSTSNQGAIDVQFTIVIQY